MSIDRSRLRTAFFVVCGYIMILSSNKVAASGLFPQSRYIIAQGQDILLAKTSLVSYDREWKSHNTKVATVDNRGIVHSVGRGKTTIEAINKKTHLKSVCTVEVIEPELLKNCYSSRGAVGRNESFEICAITQTSVKKVKFKVSGQGYYKEYENASSRTENQSKIWKMKIAIPNKGKFNIHIDCNVGGVWNNCHNKSINNIIVSNNTGGFSVNRKEKRVSVKCAEFIASCEGMRSRVYQDSVGHMTIGCGKKLFPYEPFYNNLSNDEIMAYFMESLNQGSYARAVNNFLISNRIKFSQNQFDALVSFSFNLGAGWLINGSYLKTLLLNSGSGGNGKLSAIVDVDDSLRVREKPTTNSRKLRNLAGGESVTVLDEKKFNGNWYKIRTYDGIVGYCYADYLKLYRESGSGKSLNNINRNEFTREFLQYHHAGGKCYSALLSRRAQELDMFFGGKYGKYDWKYYAKMSYDMPRCAVGKF